MLGEPLRFIADSRGAVIARRGHLGNPGLMLGLGTRIFGFLLGCTMLVAILTAVDFAGKGLSDFLYLSEWLLLLLLFWFVFAGGGKLSADAVIAKRKIDR
jgi:uncharacterized membrane protein YphA (DoxX/SURF4 family)